MIEEVGESIDLEPQHKIPDSGGEGFKQVGEDKKIEYLNADINRRIEEIKNLKRIKSERIEKRIESDTGLSPSGEYTLKFNIDTLIRELSEKIKLPGVKQKYLDKAFGEVDELAKHFMHDMDIAEPEPEPEMGRKKKKKTNRRKKK